MAKIQATENAKSAKAAVITKASSTSTSKSTSALSILLRMIFVFSLLANLVTIHKGLSLEQAAQSDNSGTARADFFQSNVAQQRKERTAKQTKQTKQQKQKQKQQQSQRQKHAKKSGPQQEQQNKTVQERMPRDRSVMLPFPLINFFSHIPKTGAEYASKELSRLLASTIPMPGNRTIKSVKEAQARYNQSIDDHYFHKNARNHDHENPDSDAYSPLFVCNQGTTPIKHLSPYFFAQNLLAMIFDLKFRCDLIVSEAPYTKEAEHVYTIVREPFSHIVSQYFHCLESPSHATSDKMVPMEEWLDAYSEFAKSVDITSRPPYREFWQGLTRARKLRRRFRCYNPIDSESDYVKFPPSRNKRFIKFQKNYTYPYPYPYRNNPGADKLPPRDIKTLSLDRYLFDDLKKRFRVIGDMARMTKTVCAIFIDWQRGEHIPKVCDCTSLQHKQEEYSVDHPTFWVPNLFSTKDFYGRDNNKWYFRPTLEVGYSPHKHAHGVKTRGAHYAENNLTDVHKTQIYEDLRPIDFLLYNVSRDVFDSQVKDLEQKHGIKICETWNRETEVDPMAYREPPPKKRPKKTLAARD